MPLSALYAAIRKGLIRINGKRTAINYRTVAGDALSIAESLLAPGQQTGHPPQATDKRGYTNTGRVHASGRSVHLPADIPILLKTTDLLIVNKPAGIPVHGNYSIDTLLSATWTLFSDTPHVSVPGRAAPQNLSFKPGPLHRLDKDTSGVLITARSAAAEAFLKDEFKMRRTEKYYAAILNGVPEKRTGVIETSVFRDGHSRIRFAASADLAKGKYARSRYKVLRVYGRYALVLFKIDTGRTHQIRLHARFIGCPIVGDPLYGKKEAEWKPYGMMLHAYRLCVALPSTREKTVFTAPLPRRFQTVLHLLRTQQANG